MKNFSASKFFYALLLSGFVSMYGCAPDQNINEISNTPSKENSNAVAGKYIVVFKEDVARTLKTGVGVGESREENAKLYAARQAEAKDRVVEVLQSNKIASESVERVYSSALLGFAGELTVEQVAKLKKDSRVAYIEQDQVVTLEPANLGGKLNNKAETSMAQTTPWGITRVGGFVNMAGSSRWAWVIDSGIDLDHPDLTVNLQFARTFATGTSSADDQNGHGTHVAGTIAAKNDANGVVGVAAGATVVPVRVFDASGSSANSIIISGVDYTTANAKAGDVANMSLGGGASTATDDAVRRLAAKGVRVAVAAGNSAANANNYSPARVNATNVWTISAHDSNNRLASFSNFANPPIDFSAPGVSIYSCWLNGGYNTISGTSMATPHVAGILLVNNGVIRSSGTITGDRDTTPDLRAVR